MSEPMVVGIDPGGTTGIALWSRPVGLSLLQIADPMEAMNFIASCAKDKAHTIFVIEKYIITPTTAKLSQQHDALEIIGATRYLAASNMHRLVMQSPSEAKGFATDAKLKRIGWYKPGLEHARDASRHVLTYLAKQGIIDLASLIEGE